MSIQQRVSDYVSLAAMAKLGDSSPCLTHHCQIPRSRLYWWRRL